ncbi:MAG: hypothetical protein V4736_11615 [Bdellovibrionota bacterium]
MLHLNSLKNVFVGLLAITLLAGCGKINALIDLPETLKGMNEKMSGMEASTGNVANGVRDQQLGVPYAAMMDKANWEILTPVPIQLMPYGEMFAKVANDEELMKLTFVLLKDIRESKINKGYDMWTDSEAAWSKAEAEEVFREKMAKVAIIQIIAGFTPEPMVQTIIQKHIYGNGEDGSGRYKNTAYAFLAFRAQFIKDILLESSLLPEKFEENGQTEKGIVEMEKLDVIGKTPFTEKLKAPATFEIQYYVNAVDTDSKSFDFSYAFNPADVPAMWKKLQKKAASVTFDEVTETSLGNGPASFAAKVERKNQLLEIISQKIAAWDSKK